MRKMLLATATAISMAAVPAMAQDYTDDGTTMQSYAHLSDLNEEERADYDSWDIEIRTYYDGLGEDERYAWWRLNDDQRIQLYNMNEADRVRAWTAINAQMAEMKQREMDNNVTFVSNTVMQEVPMPRMAHDGDYPICESDYDDHCINAWAAGQRGPGVDRPLMYWPGESVTEMRSGG